MLPQPGKAEQDAYQFGLAPHAGLVVNALQVGAGGVDGDPHRRRRLVDRFALRQPGGQPRLDHRQRVQLAQVLLVAVEPYLGVTDED